jgi:DNA invertase Pin-like site-specific DNA recombinase
MQSNDFENSSEYDYRGKRAVVLLRVSTEEQEKKYGFPSQLRSVREKLIQPRGIRILDEEKHIIRDTYTGMEFREREELAKILEMAKRKEFDVLIMDVLDRLGRVGLPREIYRAELRIHGIRILTTKPEEHADDDSLMGQMIRLLHGFKSEEERNDIIRRTQNGKRERVLKDHKLLGNHPNKYGWKYADADKGNYVLDEDLIKIPLDGTILRDENKEEWTRAKVLRQMFVWIERGWTVRVIAAYLTSQHIPTYRGNIWNSRLVKIILSRRYRNLTSNQPILAYGYIVVMDENNEPYTETSIAEIICVLHDKGIDNSKIAEFLNQKRIPTGREAMWLPGTVNHMLSDEAVIGRAAAFVHRYVKEPGGKLRQFKRPKDEQLSLPDGVVPPILVTEEGKPDIALFERVQARKKANQTGAPRNNQHPYDYLLRGGYIKCGYCGGVMRTASPGYEKNSVRHRYCCINNAFTANKCVGKGNRITASIADNYAWSKAVEIIRDPTQVDRELEARRKEDPNADKRQLITEELAKIKAKQKRLRDRLEDEDMDDDTYADVKLRLKNLAEMKRGYEHELTLESNIHEEWEKEQEQLKNFHRKCDEYRKKIDDSTCEPDYEFKREAIEFFGVIVRVRHERDGKRMEAESNPPSIVSNGSYT